MLAAELKPCATVTIAKSKPPATVMPRLSGTGQDKPVSVDSTKLPSDVTVEVAKNKDQEMSDAITGAVRLVKNGTGRLILPGKAVNSYSGGTVVNEGMLFLITANQALGAGPLTLNNNTVLGLEHVDGTNPLILNGGEISAGNGFGDSWNAPITLNGIVKLTAYATFHLNNKSGGMSGPGGFAMMGGQGAFGPSNSGTVALHGVNTYTGPTTVWLGTLLVKKAASLYNADLAKWTAENITVFNTATLVLSVGGKEEFTGAQIGILFKNLTTKVDNNGLMAGAVFCLDTTNATETINITVDITDGKGTGAGFFTFKKYGGGTLQLTGTNSYSGQTFIEGGTLIVASFNSVIKGNPSSSLGAPTTLETGMICMRGDSGLTYTGTGEVTDRILDLTGDKQTVTLDHSGSGLLKFTSPFDISGYGHGKNLVLKGSTTGNGEFGGNLRDPYDRKKKATMALSKMGTGTWILSGINTYTGPTTVAQGTLSITNAKGLSSETDLTVAEGASLDLRFQGEATVHQLSLGGMAQTPGTYNATNAAKFIKGTGSITVRSVHP